MVLSHGSTLVWTQILPVRLPSLQANGDVDDVRNEESSHNAQDNHHNQDSVVIFRGRVWLCRSTGNRGGRHGSR